MVYIKFAFQQKDMLRKIFKAFITPELKYAAPIWLPHLERDTLTYWRRSKSG